MSLHGREWINEGVGVSKIITYKALKGLAPSYIDTAAQINNESTFNARISLGA